MSGNASTAFFSSWHTYQKVVDANHMFHREISAQLRRFLAARFSGRPVSILDLGCGDAATVGTIVQDLELERYKGVDLSEPALALAAQNLGVIPCPVELVQADICAALSEETGLFDVIYSSFSLHHLASEQKAGVFRLAAKRLTENGMILLADVMRAEDESLAVYYERYCSWLRKNFTALDMYEQDRLCDHIMTCDLPEPVSVLKSQARAAGFGTVQKIARHNWHHLLCFSRN
jgi:SAM-dependent methyltransferase